MRRVLTAALILACSAYVAASAWPATGPMLTFKLFTTANFNLGQVLWTGRSFVLIAEHQGALKVADAQGKSVEQFATFPQGGDEMRCAVSPGGTWPAGVFCHTADNRVVQISPDGSSVTLFAKLPSSAVGSDGGIAFDHVGSFGRRMLVSSGGSTTNGGAIYAISSAGAVSLIGSYPGPGGADNIVVAPARFGTASGNVLISRDYTAVTGTVLAMNNRGRVSILAAHLGNGVNAIQVIAPAPSPRRAGSAAPGLYFGDQASGNVYFAPAAPLRPYTGDVIVGGEQHAWFWILRPHGTRFETIRVQTNLASKKWTLEGAAYVP